VNLGALTYDAGASVVFNGPAYANAATTTSGQPGAYGGPSGTVVPATANITTTSDIVGRSHRGYGREQHGVECDVCHRWTV
jgi:hypothetical protein